MAGDSTALNVVLTANTKRLEQDLKKAGVIAEGAVADVEDKFAKANIRMDVCKGSFAGSLASGAVKAISEQIANIPSLIADANKAIAEIGRTSSRTGLSTDRIQEIQFAGGKEGIDTSATLTALDTVAKKIDEIKHGGENGLSKLFDDNKQKVTDLNGVLATTANLMRGASNAFEKEKIAEAVGLTKDWVPVLEDGAAAFNKVGSEAYASGAVIDKDIIQRAKDFQRDWDNAVSEFATSAKANLGPFLKILIDAVGLAARFASLIGDKMSASAANSLLENGSADNPAALPDVSTFDKLIAKAKTQGVDLQDSVFELRKARLAYEDEQKKTGTLPTLNVPGGGKGTTDVSSLYSKPKASGAGGLTDEEKAYNKVEDYITALEKTGRILEAQRATLGLSNAERAKAVELARLGVAPDDEQLGRIQKQISLNEQARIAIEKQQTAQQGLNEAASFAGNALLSGLDDIIFSGAKAQDVIKNLTASLAKAALQAVLLGEGPLSKMFGTNTGSAGGVGGLIGTIISSFRASGGPVQAGKNYVVGENGPEIVKFGKNGTVMPNEVVGSRGGASGGMSQTLNFAFNGGFTFDQVRDEAKRAARIGAEQGRRAAISDMSQSDRRGTVR